MWAEHREELEELEARGWRFRQTRGGGYCATRVRMWNGKRAERRLFEDDLAQLIVRINARGPARPSQPLVGSGDTDLPPPGAGRD